MREVTRYWVPPGELFPQPEPRWVEMVLATDYDAIQLQLAELQEHLGAHHKMTCGTCEMKQQTIAQHQLQLAKAEQRVLELEVLNRKWVAQLQYHGILDYGN